MRLAYCKPDLTFHWPGLEHIQKKIKYYSAVDEAIKNKTEIPSWSEIICNE